MSDDSSELAPDPIHLRDVEAADLPTLFRQQSDAESNRMAVSNPRDLDSFNEHWATIINDSVTIAKAILIEDVVVGSVSVFKWDGRDTVGYWIARAYWGRGIATRALALLLQEAAVRPLHAQAAKTNIASIRVLERCGFELQCYRMSTPDDRFPECEEAVFVLR